MINPKVIAEIVKLLEANGSTSRPAPGNLTGKLPFEDPGETEIPAGSAGEALFG